MHIVRFLLAAVFYGFVLSVVKKWQFAAKDRFIGQIGLIKLICSGNFKMKHFHGLLKIRVKFGKAVLPIVTLSLLICSTLLTKVVFTQQR